MQFFITDCLHFNIDILSLFFLFVIGIVSLPCLIYSFGYLKGQFSPGRLILLHTLTAMFILSMALVVISGNVILFLISWELMSFISYFLVAFEHEHQKPVQAAAVYILMTHIGTAFLVFAFMLMYGYAGSFDFTALKNASAIMPANTRNIIFLLFLIGFGTKAGLVPLHIWLPLAHPQAPSHISAIMSGAMIKTAIYGFIRFVIFILKPDVAWWGITLIILAGISAFVGIIYALTDQDIKKVLAFSSVENIGIILLGVGLSMLCFSLGSISFSVFSLAAGLYHLVNHCIFKGLLFLCGGSVYRATGTRDMEKLGGLIRAMPQTAFFFLIGAMAISAIPPLNGFISEWLILQSFFLSALNASHAALKVFLGCGASVLAFVSAIAAACFVKAFGITFLARPRSNYALNAKEAPPTMRAGMLVLAALCVVFGLFSAPILNILSDIGSYALGTETGTIRFTLNNFIIRPPASKEVYASGYFLALILALTFTAAVVFYFAWGRRKETLYKVWDCGYYNLTARNEYSAVAFSKPFRIAFNFFLLPYRRTQKIRDSFYHVKAFIYETRITPVFTRYVYKPALNLTFRSANFMRHIQAGKINFYIGYIFMAVIMLVIFAGKF